MPIVLQKYGSLILGSRDSGRVQTPQALSTNIHKPRPRQILTNVILSYWNQMAVAVLRHHRHSPPIFINHVHVKSSQMRFFDAVTKWNVIPNIQKYSVRWLLSSSRITDNSPTVINHTINHCHANYSSKMWFFDTGIKWQWPSSVTTGTLHQYS